MQKNIKILEKIKFVGDEIPDERRNYMNKVVKTYAKKITQQRRLELKQLVEKAISQHEKFKNAYFWDPPSSAGMRRSYEKYHSWHLDFMYDGKEYYYKSHVECSCRNVYYTGCFYINDTRVTMREFKKVLKELNEAIENYTAKNGVKTEKEE